MIPNIPEIDKCDCNIIHSDVVDRVKRSMPDEEVIMDLADFFKVFGDTTRVGILSALNESEMCVCDIAALLGMTKSAISHQLRVLKQSKLVTAGTERWSTIRSTTIIKPFSIRVCRMSRKNKFLPQRLNN